jgi:predicted dehydrogenase
MNRGELKNPVWTGDVNVTGGFLYETTIHLFDMMRFQFGEIEELVGYGSQHEYPSWTSSRSFLSSRTDFTARLLRRLTRAGIFHSSGSRCSATTARS